MLETGMISEVQVTPTGLEPTNHLVGKRSLNHLTKLRGTTKELSSCGFESRCSHLK